jgi:transposase
MDRQTLRDWMHRYNAEGLAGLVNRKAPGRRRYLDEEQRAELARLVEEGPAPDKDGVVRWRRIDLKRKIEDSFGVRMHERTVSKQLVELGFAKMTVRPQHPKADVEAQEAFKKTSRTG